MSTNTCRCRKDIPPEAQALCNECAVHQVTTCAACGARLWWEDAETVKGRQFCNPCAERALFEASGGMR